METLTNTLWTALRAAFTLAFVLGLLGPRLAAQVNATATLTGQVTDPLGAAVPNATVKTTNQETGVAFTHQTAADGIYTVPLLKPGVYSIEVSASGLATITRKDITVEINQVAQEDFKMQVSAVQTQFTVEGGAPLLNTESTEVGNVINQSSTEQLPLNGRNFSQLGYLVPGTNSGPIGGIRTQGNGNETQRAGAEIVADGSRGTFNLFMIDGLDDRDQSVGTLKVFPNLESIEEFKVQMGNYDAEYAAGGAVVNVITRSGSNQLHGSAFEFLRNTDLDCRQFFDSARPPYQQSQFGFAVGGPIIRNHTFFFGDFQGLRTHQSSSAILTEPTAAMRNGDFSSYPAVIYNPTTYNSATNTRTAFNNNQIGPLNPAPENLLALFPLPNLSGVSNNLRVNPLEATSQNEYDIRVDQVIASTDSMFGRVTHGGANLTWPDTPVLINGVINPLAFAKSSTTGNLAYNHDPSDQATLQEIHQFSANVTNQLALGYTRVSLKVLPLEEGDNLAATLGVWARTTPANSPAAWSRWQSPARAVSARPTYRNWYRRIRCKLPTWFPMCAARILCGSDSALTITITDSGSSPTPPGSLILPGHTPTILLRPAAPAPASPTLCSASPSARVKLWPPAASLLTAIPNTAPSVRISGAYPLSSPSTLACGGICSRPWSSVTTGCRTSS